jgi:DNA polymerase I
MKKETLILLDGNAIFHRSFHAIRPLHTKEGEQVNAVFGFASILLTILSKEHPKYIACAFDTKAPTFRHEEYKEYKATRKKAPDELYAQIPRIHEVVETLQIPKMLLDGYEADDIIGTVAKTTEKKHPNVLTKIVTSDMDAFQLVTDNICIADLHKGYTQSKTYFSSDVMEKHGLTPEQIIDFKALAGDSSDNIPGVKGIGKKGATDMLQQYGTLDGIYQHVDEIKGNKQKLLKEQKEQAYFSQRLATIKLDVPLPFTLGDCQAHDFDVQKVVDLFEQLQFYSLIRRLRTWKESQGLSSTEIDSIFGAQEKRGASPTKKRKTETENQMQLF